MENKTRRKVRSNQRKSIKELGCNCSEIEVCYKYNVYVKGLLKVPKSLAVNAVKEYVEKNLGSIRVREKNLGKEHILTINMCN